MKQFCETYREAPKLSPLVRVLPWTRNAIIFSRCTVSVLEGTIVGNQKLSAALRELQPIVSQSFNGGSVVQYALSRHLSPTLIAQCQLQLPDKKLLQAKLHELFEHARGEET